MIPFKNVKLKVLGLYKRYLYFEVAESEGAITLVDLGLTLLWCWE